ncbi:N,N'-diacetylchitobiose phosphorylase [Eubacteriaceae bacterium CHKCI005]|nr:N,N'-diacetylchitobiose phosphorylase [Eubacteriaceae bacterium CHKCI005]
MRELSQIKQVRGFFYDASEAVGRPGTITRVSMYALRRQLGRELNRMREQYQIALGRQKRSDVEQWLCDNFYLIEKNGRALLRELKYQEPLPARKGQAFCALYHVCEAICAPTGGMPDPEGLERQLQKVQHYRLLQGSELENLELMLRAALIHWAARAASQWGKEEENAVRLGNAIQSLRAFQDMDFIGMVERLSGVESILRGDPARIYSSMSEDTRGYYRHCITRIARRTGRDEMKVARDVLHKAQEAKETSKKHVGYWIEEMTGDRQRRKRRGRISLTVQVIFPVTLSILAGALWGWWLIPLLIFPLWEAVRPLVDFLALKGVPPTFLPRMELDGEVPKEAPALVTVSTLLSTAQKTSGLRRRLEHLYRTNGRGETYFCLLADLKEAKKPQRPEDASAVAAASRIVRDLNRQYGQRFFLLVRPRVYSKTQRAYVGWERKRGALLELCRLIKGERPHFLTVVGPQEKLSSIRYIIALDGDTELLMDTAADLVAKAMHPLNRPQVDRSLGRVVKGYGILAPRVDVDLRSAGQTDFSRIMAGLGGVTAYDTLVGDFYQDLFGEGIFAGKGLLDVDAFYEVLNHALPENQVLSHDILEGGFLRTAFVSDVEMSDGFPTGMGPWMARLHRWIRGDWQNIVWISSATKTADGKHNPLNALSRYKLFDNLRRSFTPVIAMACILLSTLVGGGAAWALTIAGVLSCAGAGLFSAVYGLISGGMFVFSRRYYSKAIPQASQALLQAGMQLMMLPRTALVSLDAIVRALWRRFYSGRGLLDWVTAADTEQYKHNTAGFIKTYGIGVLLGAVLIIWGKVVLAWLLGLAFLSLPLTAWATARPDGKEGHDLSSEQRDMLQSHAAAMWRYYEDLCTPEDHWLPPDNMQEAPVTVTAHRTSPTNIGLAMLSTMAAHDFGLIDRDAMVTRLGHMVDTIQRLERWNGNLLNWYDTLTLRPLTPRYVSCVDSGNFVCCLVSLKEGLKEMAGDSQVMDLVARLECMIDETDLGVFYNPRRRLLHIGYDLESGQLSGSYYDLLMSEARMTSYFAVASRQVPKKHWGALGRTLARQGRYTGPVSWTGTMFEYFMPYLVLPSYEGSLGYEALRFCTYCQRRRTRGIAPWGISESGFYAFDPQLNYQYKAHGVQKLGLKRGMDSELVVSPYSTYLTLPFEPQKAIRNLQRLGEMDITGRYGMYEAADFTVKRRLSGADYAVVRSYMAHHVGMSLVAVANLLYDGVFQRRFLRDGRMSSAVELLEEKAPAGTVVFDDVEHRPIPQKVGRTIEKKEEYQVISPANPRMHLLQNDQWTLAVTDTGAGVSTFRGMDVVRRSDDLLRRPEGIFAVVKGEGEPFSITPLPMEKGQVQRRVEFASSYAAFYAKENKLEAGMMASLHPILACEQRKILLQNHSSKPMDVQVLFFLEPALIPAKDDAAHPAFSRLFLRSSYDPSTQSLVFSRRKRGKGNEMHLAVGFLEQVAYEYDLSRERILTRPYGVSSLLREELFTKPFTPGEGVPDTACCIRATVNLPPKGQKALTLLLSAAGAKEDAVGNLAAIREEGDITPERAAVSPLAGGGIEQRIGSTLLPRLFYPMQQSADIREAAQHNRLGAPALWSMGISGDVPIVLVILKDPQKVQSIQPFVKLHKILRRAGIPMDLCILYREGGQYDRPAVDAIRWVLKTEDIDSLLGQRGGIHLVDEMRHEEQNIQALKASAVHIASEHLLPEAASPTEYRPMPVAPVEPIGAPPAGFTVEGGVFHGDAFTITKTPPMPWGHVLANPAFGTMVGDLALGYTWAVNARENKLTPWYNDSRTDNRGEQLLLRLDGRIYDCTLGAVATFTPGYARWEGMAGDVRITVTASVPPKGTWKEVLLEMESPNRPVDIQAAYYTEPVLGVGRGTARYQVSRWEDGALTLQNPWNTAVPGAMLLTADGGADAYTCSRPDFLSGLWDGCVPAPTHDPCGAVIVERRLPPRRRESIKFILGWAASEEAVRNIPGIRPERGDPVDSIRIHTPDPALDALINTWLPHQVAASRFMGKTGFYQCGGAWGFRDQLQDCLALMLTRPKLARRHIIRAAAHQFEEGDVMHWWHALPRSGGGERGVRTRYSDDLLWLPYVLCEYLKTTGDQSILEVPVHYLHAEELREEEHDRYFEPVKSSVREGLYHHAVRAVERSMKWGRHGLPLMGGGDWNDGYNLVGAGGQGESVWLGMFLTMVLENMAPLCRRKGEDDRARRYEEEAKRLRSAIDQWAWDGDWYLRAFYDDGSPMGSHENDECRIDSLPQSFSVLCSMPDGERRSRALDWCMRILVDDRHQLVRLFYPPFDQSQQQPGYVKAYPTGLRENGGQYTHAACWLAMALLREGRADDALKVLHFISPAEKYRDPDRAAAYQTEPYAIAADIYAHPDAAGRGGWSQYTGAAGWYYRIVIEELLGIRIRGDAIEVHPNLPTGWSGFTAEIVRGGVVTRVNQDGVVEIQNHDHSVKSEGRRPMALQH